MKNNTSMKIPKKYHAMIDEIVKDSDGIWVYTAKGFYSPEMSCHTIHEDTQAEVLRVIRGISPCNCVECE